MGRLIQVAFVGHLAGIGLTIFATGFWTLYAGTLAIGLANGCVEAALNPLTATLYPEAKTERLNLLHVWFPGGIVSGGLAALALTSLHFGWQAKMAAILIPTAGYGVLFYGQRLPATERVQNRVSTAAMYREALRPGFLVLLFCILLTAATELGPNQWIPSILTTTSGIPGIVVLVWITGLMALGRRFVGVVVSRVSPSALLMVSTTLSAAGLFILGAGRSPAIVMFAAEVYAVGVCWCWPTMYGITAERFPAGGAFLLALVGGAGMLSDAFIVPLMGRVYDALGAGATLRWVAVLPYFVTVVFGVIWLHDRAHGGYRIVRLSEPLSARAEPEAPMIQRGK
jgi:MFS family permease